MNRPQKRKRSPVRESDSAESPGKKRKDNLPPPEEQTAVYGPLVGNLFLLADRLRKVRKLRDDAEFFAKYEPDPHPKLGKGVFGKVIKMKFKRTNQDYAVKIVNKEKAWAETSEPRIKLGMYCEAACFREILPKHRQIIHVALICESPTTIFIVMECLSKFNLSHSYRSFTPTEARRCFYRILQALDHIHKHGIIHGDLKLVNIGVRENDKTNPILIDFGLCAYNSLRAQKTKETFKQADVFTARELKEMRTKYDIEEDIKELPDMLEMFLTGQSGIIDTSEEAWLRNPGRARYPPKPGTDKDALGLLEFMRDTEQLQDTSVEQLMEHCWFDPERALAVARARAGPSGG